MLTLLSNLIQFYIYLGASRQGHKSHFARFGPAYCVLLASLLIMVHPTTILLKDLQIVTNLCKNPVGLHLLHGCTYTGFLLLVTSVLWGTNVLQYLYECWTCQPCQSR